VHAYHPTTHPPCCPHLQGAGDVLAELAAQSAAAAAGAEGGQGHGQGQGTLFDQQDEGLTPTASGALGAAAGGAGMGGTVTFKRIAPCLLPEQEQVGGQAAWQAGWARSWWRAGMLEMAYGWLQVTNQHQELAQVLSWRLRKLTLKHLCKLTGAPSMV